VGTAPEQKTESAKNGKDSMSLPFFQSFRVQQVAPTVSPVVSVGASALKCRGLHRRSAPFAREAKRFLHYIRRVLAALSKSDNITGSRIHLPKNQEVLFPQAYS